MFSFLRRSTPRYPTIRQALTDAGLKGAGDPTAVGVLERQGAYSGRRVTYFRAFDPTRTAQIHQYEHLDAHPELVLADGHVEPSGQVVIAGRRVADGQTPSREPANRDVHADDERFMTWSADAAQASADTLSEPAAASRRAQGVH